MEDSCLMPRRAVVTAPGVRLGEIREGILGTGTMPTAVGGGAIGGSGNSAVRCGDSVV